MDKSANGADARPPAAEPCKVVVKPDIVLFGEPLPQHVFSSVTQTTDFDECNLVLILGTSLAVHPFARLVSLVPFHAICYMINRDLVGEKVALL